MIDFRCDEGNMRLEMQGSIIDITSDLCVLIRKIYDVACEQNPDTGEQFKDFVKHYLPELPFLSKNEVINEIDKQMNKRLEDSRKLLSDLKDLTEKLNEFNKMLDEIGDN